FKRSSGGTVSFKALATGKNGPITIVPPNPGTGGCVLFTIVAGDRYHMLFDSQHDIIKKNDAKTFLIKNAGGGQPGHCPGVGGGSTTTTTSTTSTTTTTTTSTSTTTTTIGGTTTTTVPGAFTKLSLSVTPGTSNCGGAGLVTPPAAPLDG